MARWKKSKQPAEPEQMRFAPHVPAVPPAPDRPESREEPPMEPRPRGQAPMAGGGAETPDPAHRQAGTPRVYVSRRHQSEQDEAERYDPERYEPERYDPELHEPEPHEPEGEERNWFGNPIPPPQDPFEQAAPGDEPVTPEAVHVPEPDPGRLWERHDNDRWIVGDAGNQPTVRPKVPHRFRNPPPDTVIDGAEIGSITYRAASVRGISHQEHGQPRQDAYAVHFTRDQAWLVGCISDGVSAGTRSHEAAAAICERISRALVDHLLDVPPSGDSNRWPDEVKGIPWQKAVRSANDAVCELARPYLKKTAQKRGESDPSDLPEPVPYAQARTIMSGTALAFIVATQPSPNGAYRAMMANVAGDSAAFYLQEGRWKPLTTIKNEGAAIFSSAVKALPADTEVDARPFSLYPGQPMIIMTDGLGDPLGAARGEVSQFLAAKWFTPPDLLAFAQHLAFYRKTFADDRTAVAVWPGPVRGAR